MMAERFFNLKSDRKNTVPGGVFSCGRGAGEKKMDCSKSLAVIKVERYTADAWMNSAKTMQKSK